MPRDQVHLDLRMPTAEARDDPGRMLLGEDLGAGDADAPAQLLVLSKDLQAEGVKLALDALAVLHGRASRVGHDVAVPEAIEEPHAGLLLDRVDPPEHRAVGLPERARGARQAFRPADRQDEREVVPLQRLRRRRRSRLALRHAPRCSFLQSNFAKLANRAAKRNRPRCGSDRMRPVAVDLGGRR